MLHLAGSAPLSAAEWQTPPFDTLEAQTSTPLAVMPQPPAPPGNLPYSHIALIGRETELTKLTTMLGRHRLVTISGIGGVGKTSLALECGRRLAAQFPDGIYIIQLNTISHGQQLIPYIAATLGLTATDPVTLAKIIGERTMLLIFDNCEHVIPSCVELITQLLASCPRLSILTTTRERLRASGEFVLALTSLRSPAPTQPLNPRLLQRYPATELFLERARAANPRLHLTAAAIAAVAEICRQLSGIPLALELAAAHTATLSLQEISYHLDDRFALLGLGTRDSSAHHQTLLATYDWSWQLLSPAEQMLLATLSVFAGPFSLDAAVAVGGDETARVTSLLPALEGLIDKSLVEREEIEAVSYYHLLEPTHEYAARQLNPRIRQASLALLADHYTRLAQEAERGLVTSMQASWQKRLTRELPNLRQAISFLNATGDHEGAVMIVARLRRFWFAAGYLDEGCSLLEQGLANSLSPMARAATLHALGDLAWGRGQYPASEDYYRQALAIRRKLDNINDTANTLHNLTLVLIALDQLAAARELVVEALSLYREVRDQRGIACALSTLAGVLTATDDEDGAVVLLKESSQTSRIEGFRDILVRNLVKLGTISASHEKYAAAIAYYKEAMEMAQELGMKGSYYSILNYLAGIYLAKGELSTAWSLLEEAMSQNQRLGHEGAMISGLELMGSALARSGEMEAAARLLGAASQARTVAGSTVTIEQPFVRHYYAQLITTTPLDWHDGTKLSVAEAAAEALRMKPQQYWAAK